MKHLEKFSHKYNPSSPFESELINGARHGDLDRVKKALKNGENIDYQKKGDNITALIMAAYYQNLDIVDYLIQNNANWNLKDITGDDFVDMMISFGILNYLINKYPEKYKEYLIKKDADNYNL